MAMGPRPRAGAADFTVTINDAARKRDVTAVGCVPDKGDANVLYVFAHGFDCAGAGWGLKIP
eukprot:gene13973-23487_t